MSNFTRQDDDLALMSSVDSLLYCAQFNGANNAVLLLNRKQMPLGHRVRNSQTEKAATFYCRMSNALIKYCKGATNVNEGYFFKGTPPEIGTAEYTDLIRRINVFMSSGLYPDRKSFFAGQEGRAQEKMLRDAIRMLPFREELDVFDTIIRCGGFDNSVPCSYEITQEKMTANQGFKQGLGVVQRTIADSRFAAVCGHLGVHVTEQSKGDFDVQLTDEYDWIDL